MKQNCILFPVFAIWSAWSMQAGHLFYIEYLHTWLFQIWATQTVLIHLFEYRFLSTFKKKKSEFSNENSPKIALNFNNSTNANQKWVTQPKDNVEIGKESNCNQAQFDTIVYCKCTAHTHFFLLLKFFSSFLHFLPKNKNEENSARVQFQCSTGVRKLKAGRFLSLSLSFCRFGAAIAVLWLLAQHFTFYIHLEIHPGFVRSFVRFDLFEMCVRCREYNCVTSVLVMF